MESQNFQQFPRAIPILVEERGKLKLCEEGLKTVFENPRLQGKAISIISISGGFREGKSFMLNFFLRYLRNKGHENTDCWMGDESDAFDDGFVWKGGQHACTSGIEIWSEVFFEIKNGQEVGILLMDTQGLFDGRLDKAKDSIVFALSTLISSVQIYNLSRQIKDNHLEYLQFFTNYARAAQEGEFDTESKPFQTLTFLIRDWPHAVELGYGMDGGKSHIKHVLGDDSTSEELRRVKQYLSKCFETINCCLLPYPGKKVAETRDHGFCLRLMDVDKEFLKETAAFVPEVLKPENLVVKCLNGQPVDPLAMRKYISVCANSLDNGNLPKPGNMMENVATIQNLEALRQCVETYRTRLDEIMGDAFMAEDLLLDVHDEISAAAYDSFRAKTRFGGESRQKYRIHLEDSIKRHYDTFKELNSARKIAAESRLMNLVEKLVNEYEDTFTKNALEDQEYLTEEELKSWNLAISMNVLQRFDDNNVRHHSFAGQIRRQLQNGIKRSYMKFESDNTEKRKIAEQQDRMKQLILRNKTEIVINFRNAISQMTNEYMDPQDLSTLCETERRNRLDMFRMQLQSIGSDISPNYCKNEEQQLDERLQFEIETFQEINQEKEEKLSKHLESQMKSASVQYELLFQTILKNGYMEEKDLRAQHDEIVRTLMDDQRKMFNARQLSQHPVMEHLKQMKEMLDRKYVDTKAWNDKNYSILGKIFRVMKEYGPSLAAAAAQIALKLVSLS